MGELRKFDPDQSWAPLDARISKERDPRRREVLERVRDHMRTEISGDFDGLMATLTDDPRYHFWGLPVEGGPKGREAVSDFYRQMIDGGGHRFHFDIERIVVDDDTVVTEGKIHQKTSVEALRVSGIEEVEGEPLDDDATYIAETHIVTVWPIASDGRIIGEDIYFGSPPLANLRRL
jgi:limonene-1,2-epoxide hydrolase